MFILLFLYVVKKNWQFFILLLIFLWELSYWFLFIFIIVFGILKIISVVFFVFYFFFNIFIVYYNFYFYNINFIFDFFQNFIFLKIIDQKNIFILSFVLFIYLFLLKLLLQIVFFIIKNMYLFSLNFITTLFKNNKYKILINLNIFFIWRKLTNFLRIKHYKASIFFIYVCYISIVLKLLFMDFNPLS